MRNVTVMLCVGALALGCRSDPNPTPSATTVLDWKRSAATSMGDIKLGADVGDGAVKKQKLRVQPDEGALLDPKYGEILFDFELSHGPVEVSGSDSRTRVLVPRHVKAVLIQNDHWRIESECRDSISVPLGSIDKDSGKMLLPEALFQSCDIRLRRGDYDTRSVTLEMFGDGRVDLSAGGGTARFSDQ